MHKSKEKSEKNIETFYPIYEDTAQTILRKAHKFILTYVTCLCFSSEECNKNECITLILYTYNPLLPLSRFEMSFLPSKAKEEDPLVNRHV